MELYHTTDIDGVSEMNPSEARMRSIIALLDEAGVEEAEHPDIALVHDASGWSMSLFASGIVTFENLDDDDESPRYLTQVSRSEALQLWLELSQGNINSLLKRDWKNEGA